MSSGASREPATPQARLPERLTGLLAPVVGAADLDLEGVEVTPAGRRRLLRVVIDRDGGVDLDDIATASHAISAALDSSDVMGAQPYVLEVSSPGVDRPLTAARHWRRAQGRLVRAALAGGEVVTGRVVSCDDAAATLEVDGSPVEVWYGTVTSARVEVEFNRVGLADLGPAAADESDDDESDDDDDEDDEDAHENNDAADEEGV